MEPKRRRPRRGKATQKMAPPGVPPRPLGRAPKTDLEARMTDLDQRVFTAVATVSRRLNSKVNDSTSTSELQYLTTVEQLVLAMQSTHRSIRRLLTHHGGSLETAVDALPLTRVQMERCFLMLLLADHPKRWHTRYRKNAWKAFAEKFFRDQRTVGHLEGYEEYFGCSGTGITSLRAFAREMDVSEDEFQTLRSQVLCDDEEDPRWKRWFIADMPTPGKCLAEFENPVWKDLAELLYPYYDNLSHFSHGGMVGVMAAAVLRGAKAGTEDGKDQYHTSAVLETALPPSYAATMFVATLAGRQFLDDSSVRSALIDAWRPYVCDGSPLGVALWDAWARDALDEE